MLSVTMLSVTMLSVTMLSVTMQSVAMLSVAAPFTLVGPPIRTGVGVGGASCGLP